MSDAELLQSYVRDHSQTAFAALVERYLDLVYSAALRQLRSTALAEEVAQAVFIELSRHAARLKPAQPLAAWLYLVTRRTALNVIRREVRRQVREHAAWEIATMKTPSASWSQVENLVDEAMESLDERERAAVVLRFFQNLPLREVGAVLGISDDAAQKRVSRALDQLRTFFLRRGIAVTAAGLATDLSAHALHTAPATLGAAITTGVEAGVLPAIATSATTVTMTFLEKSILTAGLIVTLGGALFEAGTLRTQRRATAEIRQQIDQLTAQEREAQSRFDLASREAGAARQRSEALDPSSAAADPALEATMAAWLDRAARLRQLAREQPKLAIPELEVLTFDQWLEAARDSKTATDEQIVVSMANLRKLAETSFVRKLQRALKAYRDAHGGAYPEDSAQLAPLFTPPIPAAALARYKVIATGDSTPASPRPAIEQMSPADPLRDSTWVITDTVYRSTSALQTLVSNAARALVAADPELARKIDNERRRANAAELKPYLPANVDLESVEAFLNPSR